VLFACRFALVPMALGLSIGIVLVLYRFFEQIVEIIGDMATNSHISDADFLTDVLTLVDLFLIAGLLTMVMIAGYENFVSRTRLSGNPEMPSWIGRLSHHDLKLNLSLTIVAISMFLLLQVFLSMTEEDTELPTKTIEVLPWMIGIHITFVFSAVALAVINRLSHKPPRKEQGKDTS
jgi:uncharacterized protein (TIGR00645 family)